MTIFSHFFRRMLIGKFIILLLMTVTLTEGAPIYSQGAHDKWNKNLSRKGLTTILRGGGMGNLNPPVCRVRLVAFTRGALPKSAWFGQKHKPLKRNNFCTKKQRKIQGIWIYKGRRVNRLLCMKQTQFSGKFDVCIKWHRCKFGGENKHQPSHAIPFNSNFSPVRTPNNLILAIISSFSSWQSPRSDKI